MQVSNSLKSHRKPNQKNMYVLSCQANVAVQTMAGLLIGGADADRTRDLLNAIQALSQTELQPHRWRDFSANRIQPMESTDRFNQSRKVRRRCRTSSGGARRRAPLRSNGLLHRTNSARPTRNRGSL